MTKKHITYTLITVIALILVSGVSFAAGTIFNAQDNAATSTQNADNNSDENKTIQDESDIKVSTDISRMYEYPSELFPELGFWKTEGWDIVAKDNVEIIPDPANSLFGVPEVESTNIQIKKDDVVINLSAAPSPTGVGLPTCYNGYTLYNNETENLELIIVKDTFDRRSEDTGSEENRYIVNAGFTLLNGEKNPFFFKLEDLTPDQIANSIPSPESQNYSEKSKVCGSFTRTFYTDPKSEDNELGGQVGLYISSDIDSPIWDDEGNVLRPEIAKEVLTLLETMKY